MGSDTQGRSLTRSSEAARTVGVRLLNYALGFGASVLIARALGPAGRGEYFVIATIAATALSLGHLSVEHANLYLWPRADRKRLLGSSLTVAATAGTLVALLAGLTVLALGQDIVPVADSVLLWVALAAVPGGLAALYLNGLLVNGGWLWTMNKAALFAAVVQVGAVVVLALTRSLSVSAVIWIWAVSTVIPVSLQLRHLIRTVGVSRPSRHLLGRVIGIGLRYHAGMIAFYLVLRVDIYMLNATTTAATVGLYSLAVTLAEASFLVTDSIAQAAVSGQLSSEDTHGYTARIMRTNFLLAVLLVGLLVATGPVVIPLLFGEPFGPSVAPLVALAPGIVALATQRPLGVFANQQNRPWLVSGVALAALAANVLLNLALIPRFGIVGAGVASSLSYVALTAFYLAWFRWAARPDIPGFIPRVSDVLDPIRALANDMRRPW